MPKSRNNNNADQGDSGVGDPRTQCRALRNQTDYRHRVSESRRGLLKNQHELGEQQYQVHHSLKDIGTPAVQVHHADQQGQQQQVTLGLFQAQLYALQATSRRTESATVGTLQVYYPVSC